MSRFVAGSTKAQITLDVSRALASACGRHGIAAGAWEGLKRRAAALHRRLALKRRRRRLAFAEVPYESKRPLRDIERAVRARSHLSSMLVLGIGGSALGTRTIVEAVGPGKKPVHVLDNVDPETAAATLDRLDLRKTLVNVVTKSGGTAETLALLLRVLEYARRRKVKIPPEHVVVTTDPQPSELSRIAAGEGWALLTLPRGVGGRFSVLTCVGMFPAHFAGLRAVEILAGARRMADALWFGEPRKNPALLSALLLHALATKKEKSVLAVMPYADRLLGLARWHAQLWAESLGKERDLRRKPVRAGQTPVVARGATDQHSQLQLYLEGPRDKVVAFLRVEKFSDRGRLARAFENFSSFGYLSGKSLEELLDAEARATAFALARAGCPNFTLSIPALTERTLGALFYFFEFQTVAAAALWNVNPFDQPGVEAGKHRTYALMGRKGYAR
ncbi:MAG: glucose-6-phosphate isomerase [Acidobacteriota bacterium]|nr:MAG: glucose-6-phosphate isomerase [Acidobacteriota bacterium]